MRVQHRLHLSGVNVEAGADDQFLSASGDVEMTLAVHPGEIPCVEPSEVVDRCRRLLRSAIVAEHHVGTADVEFAHLAGRNVPALQVHDPVLDTGKKGTD